MKRIRLNLVMCVVAASALLFTTCNKDKDSLSVSPSELMFDADDESVQTVIVTTNIKDWEVATSFEWINIQRGDDIFTVMVDLYFDATQPRTGTITVKAAGKEVSVTVNQSAAEEYPSYNTAMGGYFGNFGNGAAIFGLDMFNASDDRVGMQIFGINSYAPAGKFKLDAGTYSLTEYGEIKSFFDGEYDDEEGMFFGTFAYDFNLEKFILITGGTFHVELSNNKYTITTNFTGKDAFTKATVNKIRYRYTGTIQFEDFSIDMSTTGIGKSNFTATGTPQLSFEGGGHASPEWDGLVTPVYDDDFGQYIAISNFADEDIEIYADFINGKFILDTFIGEDDSHVVLLEAFLFYDDELLTVNDLWDFSIQYDHESQTIDFSKSFDFSEINYPEIGLQNFSIGISVRQKSDGQPVGFLTNIYPDIKLALTPASPTSAKASKSSGKMALHKKELSRSKLTSFSQSKKVISIDKSQLVPVNEIKFDRTKLNNGKPMDRRNFRR